MSSRRPLRWFILVAFGLFIGFVLLDALGVFDDRPYYEVPHGNHTHYVPKDRNPDVALDRFPTRPPGADERITPEGRIVPKSP